MTEEIPLLECPFCDTKAVMEESETFRWAIYCTNPLCAVCTPLCTSTVMAARVWNRRLLKKVVNE
jgi:hypothetical protein